jgi:hypothetical protein
MDAEDGSRTKNIVFAAATICHEEIRASGEMFTRTPYDQLRYLDPAVR